MPTCSNNPYGYGGRAANGRRMDAGGCGCASERRNIGKTCPVHRVMPQEAALAMAYVPWQAWKNVYDTDKALQRGTIFEELDLPFYGKGGRCR